jgi:hypothetical protein
VRVLFEGYVETSDRINLLYDDTTHHYHVIGNLTGAMAKKFVRRVARDVKETSCIHVIRHLVIAWRVLHVYGQVFESRAWTLVDIFEVSHVSPTIS